MMIHHTASDGSIFQSDDIAQTEYGSSRIYFEYQFRFLSQHFSGSAYAGGEVLVPPAESGHDEVIQSTDHSRHQQRFGLAAALFSGHQHLCSSGCFGERIFAVHIADEIFAERNQKQDTQYTTQQRADKYLHKADCHLRIFDLKDIKGGEGKDGSGNDYTGTSPY